MGRLIKWLFYLLILGLLVGWKVLKYVAEQSPPGKEWENQK